MSNFLGLLLDENLSWKYQIRAKPPDWTPRKNLEQNDFFLKFVCCNTEKPSLVLARLPERNPW